IVRPRSPINAATLVPTANSPPGQDFTTPTHSIPLTSAASAHSPFLHDLSETRASGPKCRLRRVFGLAVGADPDAAIPARPQPLTTQGRSISRAWTYYAIVALHGPVSPTFPSSRRWPFRFRPANLPERNGSPPPSSRSEPATRGRG